MKAAFRYFKAWAFDLPRRARRRALQLPLKASTGQSESILCEEHTEGVRRNSTVAEYLDYYLSLTRPAYAVMLSGPWGVGKTHFISEFMRADSNRDYAYVSLYGVSTSAGLSSALLASLIYFANGDRGRTAFGLATAWFHAKLPVELGGKTLQTLVTSDTVFVFDDLERCALPLVEILGFVNPFVEHTGCRVILVGNKDRLWDEAVFASNCEKVIGQVLCVSPDFAGALRRFLGSLSTVTQAVIRSNAIRVEQIFDQSELGNLRILDQSLRDFDRIVRELDSPFVENYDALSAALSTFLALSFEYKSGRIVETDLHERSSWFVFAARSAINPKGEERKLSSFEDASKRYAGVALDDEILSSAALLDLLVHGHLNKPELNRSFQASRFFRPTEEPWRTVWHAYERSDEEFERALEELERQYAARSITMLGVMRHIFGLRLWLSEVRVLEESESEIVEQAKRYVDDLARSGRLNTDCDPRKFRDAHDGLAIFNRDTAAYREIITYLEEVQSKVAKSALPRQAEELLRTLEADPIRFCQQVGFPIADVDIQYFHDTPVLVHADPARFAAAFLRLHPYHQRRVVAALKERYTGGPSSNLSDEVPWGKCMIEALAEASSRIPLARSGARMQRHRIGLYCKTLLGSISDPEEVVD